MEWYCDTAWELALHLALLTCQMLLYWRHPWLLDYRTDVPRWPLNTYPPETNLFYQVALGYAIGDTYMLVLDFDKGARRWPLVVHHIVQLILLGGSHYVKLRAIGLVIFLLHEPDHFLRDVANLLRLLDLRGAGDVGYGMMMAAYVVLRLALFPAVAFHCCTFARDTLRNEELARGLSPPQYYALWFLPASLCALLLVHAHFTLPLFRSVERRYF